MCDDRPALQAFIRGELDCGIARAYLDLARRARAKGKWQQARDYVHKGLVLKPLDSVSDSLNVELAEIGKTQEEGRMGLAAAQRVELEQQRQMRIQVPRDDFAARLAKLCPSLQGDRVLLAILGRLVTSKPTGSLLNRGRQRIASRKAPLQEWVASNDGLKAMGGDFEDPAAQYSIGLNLDSSVDHSILKLSD